MESKFNTLLKEDVVTPMNVLIDCEESQAICAEFRKLGHIS